MISPVARHFDALPQRVEACDPGSLAVSPVITHELYFGAYRSQKVAFNLETLRLMFADRTFSTSIGRTRVWWAKSGPS